MPNPKGNPQTLKKYQPKWRSGDTQTIRVPIALTEQILRYAHQLDEGTVTSTQSNHPDSNHLLQVIQWLEEVEKTPRNNFSKQKKELIQRAIELLKHCNK